MVSQTLNGHYLAGSNVALLKEDTGCTAVVVMRADAEACNSPNLNGFSKP